MQSRDVICQHIDDEGVASDEDDSECSEPKPESKRECNVDQPCPEWQAAPWSNVRCNSFNFGVISLGQLRSFNKLALQK